MLKTSRRVNILGVLVLTFALTGCGNAIPEMTEQQNALVTEYAAGLLLEYHADYSGRIVDTTQPPEELIEDKTLEVTLPPTEIVSENSVQEMTDEKEQAVGEAPSISEQPSISQVLNMTDFEISYTDYEVCDSYPSETDSSDAMFFAMKAGTGNKFVVAKLRIENTSQQTKLFNTLEMPDVRCRVIVDGTKYNALVTMLDNDFLALEKEMNPGESLEAIVIAELDSEKAEQIQTVSVYIRNGEKDTTLGITQ